MCHINSITRPKSSVDVHMEYLYIKKTNIKTIATRKNTIDNSIV